MIIDWSNFGLKYYDRYHFIRMPCTCTNPVDAKILLLIRSILLGIACFITATSMLFYNFRRQFQWWFIYLTHWGLLLVTLTNVFAFIVSTIYIIKLDDSVDDYDEEQEQEEEHEEEEVEQSMPKLPLYLTVYWILYNCAYPCSIFITAFYWLFLHEASDDDEIFESVLGHGINAVVMVLLLLTSRQPSRFHHFYFPCFFGIAWMIFSIIYYYAGGLNPNGKPYVYSMVDWSNPSQALMVVVQAVLALTLVHCVVVVLAKIRDYFSKVLDKKLGY